MDHLRKARFDSGDGLTSELLRWNVWKLLKQHHKRDLEKLRRRHLRKALDQPVLLYSLDDLG